MTGRLIAAAAGFSGTVVGGLGAGFLVGTLTHADWWTAVGFFGGLAAGVWVIFVALRPIMKSS